MQRHLSQVCSAEGVKKFEVEHSSLVFHYHGQLKRVASEEDERYVGNHDIRGCFRSCK
jgi:hypothetical protein